MRAKTMWIVLNPPIQPKGKTCAVQKSLNPRWPDVCIFLQCKFIDAEFCASQSLAAAQKNNVFKNARIFENKARTLTFLCLLVTSTSWNSLIPCWKIWSKTSALHATRTMSWSGGPKCPGCGVSLSSLRSERLLTAWKAHACMHVQPRGVAWECTSDFCTDRPGEAAILIQGKCLELTNVSDSCTHTLTGS